MSDDRRQRRPHVTQAARGRDREDLWLTRRWIVGLSTALLIAVAVPFIWIVIENRGSEKLVAAAAGVLILPGLYYLADRLLPPWAQKLVTPIVAVFGATVAVFLFTTPVESTRVIGVAFLMDAKDMAPVRFGGRVAPIRK